MATFIDHQKAFISLFNQTARYHRRHKVFEDFVSCSVIALENRLQFSEAREQKYLRIVSGYEKQDVINMAHLLAHVIEGLEQGFCDFLGSVFMQLELGDKYRGQFFTPWSVASMMAADARTLPRKLVIPSASFSGADCRLILNTFLPVPAFGLAFIIAVLFTLKKLAAFFCFFIFDSCF